MGTTNSQTNFNQWSRSFDLVQTNNIAPSGQRSVVICGETLDPTDKCLENTEKDTEKAFLIEIDPANGKIINKKIVGTTDKNSVARSIAMDSNGDLYISGRETNKCDFGAYDSDLTSYVLVQKIDKTNLTALKTQRITNNAYELNNSFDLTVRSNGQILVAGVMNLQPDGWFVENATKTGEVWIYRLDPTTTNFDMINTPGKKITDAKAFDLQSGVVNTSDGGYAVLTTVQTSPYGTAPSNDDDVSGCESYTHDVSLWNTDAYVAKLTTSGVTDQIDNFEWSDTYSETVAYGNFSFVGFPYKQGDIKRQECYYKIDATNDGGLILCGNNSSNFDDDYLIKLFDNCQNKLVYSGDDIDQTVYDVTSNQSWTSRKVNGTIRIKSGKTLTIDGTTIQFTDTRKVNRPSKIIIENGGKLIVKNSGKITGIQSCNSQWEGIQVWGDKTVAQSSTSSGTIQLTTGGTLENMRTGVAMDEVYYPADDQGNPDYSLEPVSLNKKTGGIIYANGANFINNRNSVGFNPYKPSTGYDNISFIKNSSFKCNSFLPSQVGVNGNPLGSKQMISLWDVHGIEIKNNLFENTTTLAVFDKGWGVVSIDADYTFTENDVKYFDRGVDASATSASALVFPLQVDENFFYENNASIYMSAIKQPLTVNLNDIYVIPDDAAYALYLDQCTGYQVEENVTTLSPSSGDEYGFFVNQSGTANNQIYHNTFFNTDMSFAVYKRNASQNLSNGLSIKCNKFNSTDEDILILSAGNSGASKGAIKSPQGICDLGDETTPAGNIFLNSCSTGGTCDIYTASNVPQFTYNYHKPSTDFEPVYYTSPNVSPNNCGYFETPSEGSACPSNIMFSGEKQMKLGGEGTDSDILFSLNNQIDSLQTYAGSEDSAAIQDQINDLQFQKSMLIRSLLFDVTLSGDMAGAAEFLSSEGEVKSSIGYYIAAENYGEASQKLAQLELQNEDDSAFYLLTELQINLLEKGNSWGEIDANQEELIRAIAFDSSNMSRAAKNILELTFGEHYPEEFPSIKKGGSGRDIVQTTDIMPRYVLYPNPAKNEFTVEFNTEIKGSADFAIFNLSGHLIYSTTLVEGTTQLKINSSQWNPGFFVSRLISEGRILWIQKLIITEN